MKILLTSKAYVVIKLALRVERSTVSVYHEPARVELDCRFELARPMSQ